MVIFLDVDRCSFLSYVFLEHVNSKDSKRVHGNNCGTMVSLERSSVTCRREILQVSLVVDSLAVHLFP